MKLIITALTAATLVMSVSLKANSELTLPSSTANLGQICYHANNDIHDYKWLEKATLYRAKLDAAIADKLDMCWSIQSKAQLIEAKLLKATDASGNTITLKS